MSKSKLDLLLNIARWLLLVSGCIFIVFGILVISLEHISSITSDVEFSPTPIEELNEGPEDDPDYRWEVKYKFKALNALYESSQYLKGKKKELRYTMKVGYVSFCPSINWIEPMDRKLAISMFGFIPGLLAISFFLIMTLKQKKVASPVQIESKEEIKKVYDNHFLTGLSGELANEDSAIAGFKLDSGSTSTHTISSGVYPAHPDGANGGWNDVAEYNIGVKEVKTYEIDEELVEKINVDEQEAEKSITQYHYCHSTYCTD